LRLPRELSKWRPFRASLGFIRKHTCCLSNKVDSDKELDIIKKSNPKIKGGSCEDDRSDTRDGYWIGKL
jgi:hypothetical protein